MSGIGENNTIGETVDHALNNNNNASDQGLGNEERKEKKLPALPSPLAPTTAKRSFMATCWAHLRPALHKFNKAPIFLVNGILTVVTLGGIPRPWPLKDRSKWIEDLGQVKPQLRLFEVAIPGTHSSATYRYESIGKPYGVCQNNSLLNQLRGGIRYLNIKVCDDAGFDNDLWVSHTLLCQRLEPQLRQICEFLDERPREIVLLFIEKDFNRHLSPTGLERLDTFVRSLFGGRLIAQHEVETLSIADLIQVGKQLVLLDANSFALPSNPDPPHIRSSWIATHDHNPRLLAAQLRGWARDTAPALPLIISNLEMVITPTMLHVYKSVYAWTKELHKIVLAPGGLLDDLKAIPNPRRNVISFDFATDDIIAAVIALNYLDLDDETILPVSRSQHVAEPSTSSLILASIKSMRWPRVRNS